MTPVVSIIVPVYNAEQVLGRCIESVLKQDYKQFELILVNDGSKDNSGIICDKYASQDDRIRVIHKLNTGVSDTRNTAITVAKGEFLQFLDSDDWITPDATRLLVSTAKEQQCDMVISDFYRVIGERVSPKGDIQENILLTREEFATHMMENPADFYYGVLWNKLYRKSIIDKYQLSMDSEISWCEDFMFNMEYIRHANSVYVLHVPLYYYVKTKGSLVSQGASFTKTIKMKQTVFEHYNHFYKDVFGEEDYEKCRFQVYRFLIDVAGDGWVMPAIMPGSVKLGKERIQLSVDAIENEGIFMNSYRERKLLERYLETVALKHELSLDEVKVLLYAGQSHKMCTMKEISEITNVSRSNLLIVMQKLVGKGLIRTKEQKRDSLEKSDKKEKTIRFEKSSKKNEKSEKELIDKTENKNPMEIKICSKAEVILADLISTQNSFDSTKYIGFTEDEIEQYQYFSKKLNKNIKDALK